MSKILKKELIQEIDICLERNDISHKEFVILESLKYLLTHGHFPMEQSECQND